MNEFRNDQLKTLQAHYARRNKAGNARMLDEFLKQDGYSRKHAIKLLSDPLPKTNRQSPPVSVPKCWR